MAVREGGHREEQWATVLHGEGPRTVPRGGHARHGLEVGGLVCIDPHAISFAVHEHRHRWVVAVAWRRDQVKASVGLARARVVDKLDAIGGRRPSGHIDDGEAGQVGLRADDRHATAVEPGEDARRLVVGGNPMGELQPAVAHTSGVCVQHAAVIVRVLESAARVRTLSVHVEIAPGPALAPGGLSYGHVNVAHSHHPCSKPAQATRTVWSAA